MILRPAYPDELGRAQSLLDGHPVPAHAAFLVAVKEQPVGKTGSVGKRGQENGVSVQILTKYLSGSRVPGYDRGTGL